MMCVRAEKLISSSNETKNQGTKHMNIRFIVLWIEKVELQPNYNRYASTKVQDKDFQVRNLLYQPIQHRIKSIKRPNL